MNQPLHLTGWIGLLVTLVVLVTACTSADQAGRAGQASLTAQPATAQPASAKIADQVATANGGTVLPLHPAADWHVRGSIRQLTTAGGEQVAQVDITAPTAELTRQDGGPNLLWHLGAGRCETTDRGAKAVFVTIFYKHTPPVTDPDRLTFTMLPIPSSHAHWRGSPLVLAAYVNGGGPFVACANLPADWGEPGP